MNVFFNKCLLNWIVSRKNKGEQGEYNVWKKVEEMLVTQGIHQRDELEENAHVHTNGANQ